jgi:hypothetical protein
LDVGNLWWFGRCAAEQDSGLRSRIHLLKRGR